MSRTSHSSRNGLLRTILLGTIGPAVFIAIGLLQQSQLGDAMTHSWAAAVLAFLVGALTVALPRKLPALGSVVAIIVFAWVSTFTAFDAIALICVVLAGFFFGVAVRSLLYQWRQSKKHTVPTASFRAVWDEGAHDRGSVDSPKWHDVQGRIAAMHGEGKSTLIVVKGQNRLEVCCIDSERFLVFNTARIGRTDRLFQALPTASRSVDPGDTADVVIVGTPAQYPKGRFVSRKQALVAAQRFLQSGGRDESLVWDTESRAHEIPVPPGL